MVLYSAQSHRQHCILHAFEKYGILYSRTCYEQPVLWTANLLWEATWPFPENGIFLYKWTFYEQPPALTGYFFCVTRVAAHSSFYCICTNTMTNIVPGIIHYGYCDPHIIMFSTFIIGNPVAMFYFLKCHYLQSFVFAGLHRKNVRHRTNVGLKLNQRCTQH